MGERSGRNPEQSPGTGRSQVKLNAALRAVVEYVQGLGLQPRDGSRGSYIASPCAMHDRRGADTEHKRQAAIGQAAVAP